jgi:hypothetical protein
VQVAFSDHNKAEQAFGKKDTDLVNGRSRKNG